MIYRDQDEDYGLNKNPEPTSGADLDTLFRYNLLWVQPQDAVKLLKETLNATRATVKEIACAL